MNKKNIKKFILATSALLGITFVGMKIVAAITKADRNYTKDRKQQNPLEGKKVVFIENQNDSENADGVKGHLEAIGKSEYHPGLYDKYIKRAMDLVLSFFGLIVLSPVIAGIALAIKIDDPGPVFFTQKRMGQNKRYFKLYKFRSMKMCTPHDVPTHMLENPEQYITRVGKFIRAHSLDELPQIFNVFAGDMSLVGPRPGLWNQDVLTAERDKYGANDVKPGITGWAQINGRDSIEIPEKAALDGEYVKKESLLFDLKCLFGTVSKVGHDDAVVEGGTGVLKREQEHMNYVGTNPKRFKKILITGKDSYIGENIKKYLDTHPDCYKVNIVDTINIIPSKEMFVGYDVVINTAGIAHVKETSNNQQLYYKINRDLCIDIALAAKEAGVNQFVVFSSMSVYGITTGHIMKYTAPLPNSAYGNSKYQADLALEKLESPAFKVAILRPPMVYGKGCKGNYQQLRKVSLLSPVFPKCKNERSMIYIGNLCEFVKNTIDEEKTGLFFPQNENYVNTSDMVKLISANHNKRIVLIHAFYPLIKMVSVDVVKKVFGSLTYEKTDIVGKYSFEESIKLSEK